MPAGPRAGVSQQELRRVLDAARRGDFSARIPVTGGKSARLVAEAVNELMAINAARAPGSATLSTETKRQTPMRRRPATLPQVPASPSGRKGSQSGTTHCSQRIPWQKPP